MRDRLIELIKNAPVWKNGTFNEVCELVVDHLIKNGVILPPCKVGDKIYGLFSSTRLGGETMVVTYVVTELLFSTKRGVRPWVICCYGGTRFDNLDFGKTVFLSKEEAEKALEGSGNDEK